MLSYKEADYVPEKYINNCIPDYMVYIQALSATLQNSITLYSILTPFGAFEISCIWKYYGKLSICSK